MGQLTLARFRGDTTFGLTAHILATFFGCIAGLIMWYVDCLDSLLHLTPSDNQVYLSWHRPRQRVWPWRSLCGLLPVFLLRKAVLAWATDDKHHFLRYYGVSRGLLIPGQLHRCGRLPRVRLGCRLGTLIWLCR